MAWTRAAPFSSGSSLLPRWDRRPHRWVHGQREFNQKRSALDAQPRRRARWLGAHVPGARSGRAIRHGNSHCMGGQRSQHGSAKGVGEGQTPIHACPQERSLSSDAELGQAGLVVQRATSMIRSPFGPASRISFAVGLPKLALRRGLLRWIH
ncbi:hypothetical protein BS78_07G194400 [Paspalum vaginatum]|nr:hypothetical protein BS78_07G194400 [Paspalum vaginatum]